jgi:hypothetical protein
MVRIAATAAIRRTRSSRAKPPARILPAFLPGRAQRSGPYSTRQRDKGPKHAGAHRFFLSSRRTGRRFVNRESQQRTPRRKIPGPQATRPGVRKKPSPRTIDDQADTPVNCQKQRPQHRRSGSSGDLQFFARQGTGDPKPRAAKGFYSSVWSLRTPRDRRGSAPPRTRFFPRTADVQKHPSAPGNRAAAEARASPGAGGKSPFPENPPGR